MCMYSFMIVRVCDVHEINRAIDFYFPASDATLIAQPLVQFGH